MKNYDLSKLTLGDNGRAELGNKDLDSLIDEVKAGGGVITPDLEANFVWCEGSSNSGCSNYIACDTSTNRISCENMWCDTSKNTKCGNSKSCK